MVDIVEEIVSDEKDVKRLRLFQKLLPIIIIFTIITAIGIAGYNYYKNEQQAHNQEIGDLLLDVISNQVQDPEIIESTLQDIVANSNNRTSELAALKLALDSFYQGQESDSIDKIEAIAVNSEYLEETTAFARIVFVSMKLDKKQLDEAEKSKIQNMLQYFSDDSKIFYGNALLLKGLFFYKIGQFEHSRDTAGKIVQLPKASQIVRQQAAALLTMIKYEHPNSNKG